jgi:3-hydroxyisobutyrate dehydrogenase-like beta-hydroxyacid dehydrogenase
MADTIVVIAAGEMGAGIGKRLTERGARVLTSLKGRGSASAARAQQAGMTDVEDDAALVAEADFILSVVPPGQAVAMAERLKGPLGAAKRNPIYLDCNAIAPESAKRIAALLTGLPLRFVDGGIIGGPPAANNYSPALYVSGEAASEVNRLHAYGIRVRPLDGPIGMASALKMSYGGLTKGLTAIGTALMLGAMHAGCGPALMQELSESQPDHLAWLTRQVPRMFPKAYRWVAEMEEISDFLDGNEASHDIYQAIARLYAYLAAGHDGTDPKALDDLNVLRAFCALPVPAAAKSASGGG